MDAPGLISHLRHLSLNIHLVAHQVTIGIDLLIKQSVAVDGRARCCADPINPTGDLDADTPRAAIYSR